MTDRPNVYVIAGPNGAGKTTFAAQYLPDSVNCREFLNADLIAAGLSPFAPEAANRRAGRLLLERVRELTGKQKDFGFETTLAGRSYAAILDKMRIDGYRINLYFLWLPSVDLAISRVANRVRQGGHSVPEADIRRRYRSGILNFLQLYRPLAASWWLYNGTERPPRAIAKSVSGIRAVIQPDLFRKIEAIA